MAKIIKGQQEGEYFNKLIGRTAGVNIKPYEPIPVRSVVENVLYNASFDYGENPTYTGRTEMINLTGNFEEYVVYEVPGWLIRVPKEVVDYIVLSLTPDYHKGNLIGTTTGKALRVVSSTFTPTKEENILITPITTFRFLPGSNMVFTFWIKKDGGADRGSAVYAGLWGFDSGGHWTDLLTEPIIIYDVDNLPDYQRETFTYITGVGIDSVTPAIRIKLTGLPSIIQIDDTSLYIAEIKNIKSIKEQEVREYVDGSTETLTANSSWSSKIIDCSYYRELTGYVYADVRGKLSYWVSYDGTNFRVVGEEEVEAGKPKGFKFDVLAQYALITFDDYDSDQSEFEIRIYGKVRP